MKNINLTARADYFNSIFENLYPAIPEQQRVILSDGSIIKCSADTESYNFFDYYKDFCSDTVYYKLTVPHIIFTGIGNLPNLESIEYDQPTVDYLNNHSLYIFLWEIISPTNDRFRRLDIRNDDWYLYFNYIFDIQNNVPIYGFEFESIRFFLKRNNLKNVKVFACEYDISKFFQPYYNEFKIFSTNNIFTLYKNKLTNDMKNLCNLEYIDSKFFSLSLRYDTHRHLIIAYLINLNSIVSWHQNANDWDNQKKVDIDYLNSQLTFDVTRWKVHNFKYFSFIEKGTKILDKRSPISLPSETDKTVECGSSLDPPFREISRCFCWVVTESTFYRPFSSLSEKTADAIFFRRPLILVSTPGSLGYLKKLGFRTFDQWWDESYDQEQDHEKRMLKIFQVIDYIDSFDIQQLKEMYLEMHDVLEHNRNLVLSLDYRKFDFK